MTLLSNKDTRLSRSLNAPNLLFKVADICLTNPILLLRKDFKKISIEILVECPHFGPSKCEVSNNEHLSTAKSFSNREVCRKPPPGFIKIQLETKKLCTSGNF